MNCHTLRVKKLQIYFIMLLLYRKTYQFVLVASDEDMQNMMTFSFSWIKYYVIFYFFFDLMKVEWLNIDYGIRCNNTEGVIDYYNCSCNFYVCNTCVIVLSFIVRNVCLNIVVFCGIIGKSFDVYKFYKSWTNLSFFLPII